MSILSNYLNIILYWFFGSLTLNDILFIYFGTKILFSIIKFFYRLIRR